MKVAVDTSIWNEYSFGLSTGLCYLWLLTNGIYSNNIGCYSFSKKVMAFYTNLDEKDIDSALKELCDNHLIMIDGKEVMIFKKQDEWTSSKAYISKLCKELETVKSGIFRQIITEKIRSLLQNKEVNNKTRLLVYNKFDGHCAYCGRKIDINYFEIDHINPKKSGGSNDMENYNPSCHYCNLTKSNRNLEEFRLYIGKSKDYKFYFERR